MSLCECVYVCVTNAKLHSFKKILIGPQILLGKDDFHHLPVPNAIPINRFVTI